MVIALPSWPRRLRARSAAMARSGGSLPRTPARRAYMADRASISARWPIRQGVSRKDGISVIGGKCIRYGRVAMCRLFGMSGGRERIRAPFSLLEAPDSLAEQSRREPDGTGVGV